MFFFLTVEIPPPPPLKTKPPTKHPSRFFLHFPGSFRDLTFSALTTATTNLPGKEWCTRETGLFWGSRAPLWFGILSREREWKWRSEEKEFKGRGQVVVRGWEAGAEKRASGGVDTGRLLDSDGRGVREREGMRQ